LTPPSLLEKLGQFDLDPCAYDGHTTAKRYYFQKGLEQDWFGRVWLNPPYGNETGLWLKKLQEHGDGMALIFARTETKWFQDLSPDAICFIKGRVKFLTSEFKIGGRPNAPSMLLAFGSKNIPFLERVDGCIYKRYI
jgi:hypothetical protein